MKLSVSYQNPSARHSSPNSIGARPPVPQAALSLAGPWTTAFEVSNTSQLDSVASAYDVPVLARCVQIHIDDCGIYDYGPPAGIRDHR